MIPAETHCYELEEDVEKGQRSLTCQRLEIQNSLNFWDWAWFTEVLLLSESGNQDTSGEMLVSMSK
jgi:hypothetical protein